MAWFPGGTKLLVSGQGGIGIWGIWTVATIGGEVRKIQDTTGSAALSPDGSRVAFEKEGEIWQIGPNGDDPKRLFAATGVSSSSGRAGFGRFSSLAWSPDGLWLTYFRKADQKTVLEARLVDGGAVATIFDSPDLKNFCWLSPTQLVLDLWEAPDRPFSNLWQIDVDPKKMRALGEPRRLTNWAGFAIETLSASTATRQLVAARLMDRSDILIGELADHGNRLNQQHRLNSEEHIEWPGEWSLDSRSLLFQSDRTGNISIFRQRLEAENPDPIATNQEDNRGPLLSPDGQWALYFAWPRSAEQVKTGRLMRIPVAGGSPEVLLEAKGFPGSAQVSSRVIATNRGQPSFRCPSLRVATCVLSEAGPNAVIFSSFAPVTSPARSEIMRVAAKDPNGVAWDLSPDGSRIAYSEHELHSATIHVRELASGMTRDISISGWAEVLSLGWSADGKSLFVTNFAPQGSSLLHVTLDGHYMVIYKAAKEVEAPKASPDGRYLAFGEVASASNVWLLEGFPK